MTVDVHANLPRELDVNDLIAKVTHHSYLSQETVLVGDIRFTYEDLVRIIVNRTLIELAADHWITCTFKPA